MYIIGMIDEGFLKLSTFTTNKEAALEVVERWHRANWSETNDEGYIAVEVSPKEGETAERVYQVDLDDEPDTFDYGW